MQAKALRNPWHYSVGNASGTPECDRWDTRRQMQMNNMVAHQFEPALLQLSTQRAWQ
jgi:hypothetical protein